MKIALFLGAGASMFVGHPTTKELMNLVREHMEKRKDETRRDANCQNYIMSVINSTVYSDVEKLYDGIEQVINTHTSSNCKPIVGGIMDNNAGISCEQIIKELKDLRSTIRNILLESFVINDDAHGSIGLVYDKIWSVIRDSKTKGSMVFTTNYDSVVESYANGLEIVNGFKPYRHLSRIWDGKWDSHTTQPPLYLTKLHGSVHWHEDSDGNIVETGNVQDRDIDHDIMIAPTEGMKDYSREPFLTLMDYFRESLRKVDILLVIGFSYRDTEIIEIIKRRLEEGMLLVSVSPSASDDIVRLSDAKPQPVDWNDSQFAVLDSGIALCNKEFGPDTIDDICSTLGTIFLYFLDTNAMKSRTVS